MFSLVECLLLLIICLLILYKFMTKDHDYFVKKNIPHIKPFLWFNNVPGLIFGGESIFDAFRRIHTHFKNEKIYGMFDIFGPGIVLNDPEIIKQITIKDSDHFMNHRELFTELDDPMAGNSLFLLRGEKWKDMRTTLTPAFTGNKMRVMFDLIQECCEDAIKYLKNELKSNLNGIDLDLKDFFTRLTNDVIGSTVFGIKVNSLVDRENQFYIIGKGINKFSFWMALKLFLQNKLRPLTRALGVNLFDKKHISYFKSLVLDSMKYREEHNIIRPDMINMLIEARKAADRKRDWSDNEIVAQCFGFFMGAFENTSTVMSFIIYELINNQDIQNRLIAEVDDIQKSLNGKPISYEILLSMKYLDMVVSEAFRKFPGVPFTDRLCTKDYLLKIDDGHEIQLKVGDACVLNIIDLHYNPDNFPDPEKFDPERFSDENKNNIKPYTYLPFGSGFRNCIGNRFALMEVKAILYYLFCDFKFEATQKTILPIKFQKHGLQLKPIGGFWSKIYSRN